MAWNYGSALQASSYYNTCAVAHMYVVAARQLSTQIKGGGGKNGSLIKQPAAAFKDVQNSALLPLLQRWGPVEQVQVLGGDKPPILTHFKGFFHSRQRKRRWGVFLLPVTAVPGIKRGLVRRRANLSFTSGEKVKETQDYGSVYESKIDANQNNQAQGGERRTIGQNHPSFHPSVLLFIVRPASLALSFSSYSWIMMQLHIEP